MSSEKLDPKSYIIGKFAGSATAWSEAARSGAKQMSLSSPFSPEDHNLLSPYIEKATGEPMSVEPYLRYLNNKYGELYDI